MNPKTKAIIIIIGAVILFALLIAVIFDLFPSRSDEITQPQDQEVVLPDRDQGLPEGAVFDASNAQEFNDLNPVIFGDDDSSSLEKEAKDLAIFFIERFGTYSSDANFANIDDLRGFMTDNMRLSMDDYKKSVPKRDKYYAVSAQIAAIDAKMFSLSSRSAVFDAIVEREEDAGNSRDNYAQQVEISLKQNNTGQWKVNNIVWGQKL